MLADLCVSSILPKKQELVNGQIRECFAKYDDDGSGTIDAGELQNLCAQLDTELNED
jgi:Ca2+-binding EF-hand superfamily protein